MERELLGLLEAVVEEEDHMLLGIVDEAEWRNAAGFEAKVTHHAFGRSERELTWRIEALRHQFGLEAMLEVMDVEVVVAMEAHEVMLVALVVAEEDVLAMHRAIIFPPLLGLLDGLAFRMVIHFVVNVMLAEIGEYFFFSFGNHIVELIVWPMAKLIVEQGSIGAR